MTPVEAYHIQDVLRLDACGHKHLLERVQQNDGMILKLCKKVIRQEDIILEMADKIEKMQLSDCISDVKRSIENG